MMSLKLNLVLVIIALYAPSGTAAQCNENDVKADDKGIVHVSANGVDDTENVQCAIELAIESGASTVKFDPGDFTISAPIIVKGFDGTMEGWTKDHTTVTLKSGSFSCVPGSGISSAFEVLDSKLSIRTLSLIADSPCDVGSDPDGPLSFTAIAFMLNPDDCGRLVYGFIDRVRFIDYSAYAGFGGPATRALYSGPHPLCGSATANKSLGTFKINRSEFEGWNKVAELSMAGRAEVDILFNTMSQFDVGVDIVDSNQITNIISNTVVLNSIGPAIHLRTEDSAAPDESTLNVIANTFSERVADGLENMISLKKPGKRANLRILISDNVFDTDDVSVPYVLGQDMPVIRVEDVDNGVITSNTFTGTTDGALMAFNGSESSAEPLSGWAIMSNQDHHEVPTYDLDVTIPEDCHVISKNIVFNGSTVGNVIGPGQTFTTDLGPNDINLQLSE